jgi:hypothetical protein
MGALEPPPVTAIQLGMKRSLIALEEGHKAVGGRIDIYYFKNELYLA